MSEENKYNQEDGYEYYFSNALKNNKQGNSMFI